MSQAQQRGQHTRDHSFCILVEPPADGNREHAVTVMAKKHPLSSQAKPGTTCEPEREDLCGRGGKGNSVCIKNWLCHRDVFVLRNLRPHAEGRHMFTE